MTTPTREPAPDPATAAAAGDADLPADVATLLAHSRAIITQRDSPGQYRRDVHTKMHGLMRAEFTVDGTVPIELRHGVFARPGTCKAWVRFSNASNDLKPDIDRDIRGMAIKLMGVPGRKLLEADADAPTHDFIVVSCQNFPVATAAQTDELLAVVMGGLWRKLIYAITHLRQTWITVLAMRQFAHLLQIRYFSPVPYALGPHVVKYVVTPHFEVAAELPSDPAHNYLRERAVAQLAQGEAIFDFAVQLQRDEASMPLDDPLQSWSLELSPPRKVATLRILQQTFDTDAIKAYGENLSFTPWHALPEHRPLGTLNAVRKTIYQQLSAFRQKANNRVSHEPSDWEV